MIKKIIASGLTAAIVLAAFCVNADSAVVSGVTWYYEKFSSGGKDVARITGCDKNTGDLIIPASLGPSYKPLPVTQIANNAFYGCSGLSSVTIPLGITKIGSEAFRGCDSLRYVSVPASMTSIEDRAFEGCSKLRTLNIPLSVAEMRIGDYAFAGCGMLGPYNPIPSGVKSIGASAFFECTGLESLVIPESVTSVGNRAFYGCNKIAILVDESSVTSIEEGTFAYCSEVWEVFIPEHVTTIRRGAFYGCKGLKRIYGLSKVTNIGEAAFAECSALTSMEIPNGVAEICVRMFENCTGLTSVTIPHGVKTIGQWAFRGCSGLTSIMIPSSVVTIDYGAFKDCKGLISVAFQWTAGIGEGAFSGCNALRVICAHTEEQSFLRNQLANSGFDVSQVRFVDGYTVTFNANGGTCSVSSKQCWPWSTLGDLPTPTRTGYTFDGWYTAASGGTKMEVPVAVTGDMTLYARWKANVYTITFNANGGSCAETSRAREYGAAYGTFPTPTRTGYLFLGWYTDPTGGTRVSATAVMVGNVTLYAQWEKRKEYSVLFNANGGSSSETSRSIYSGDAVGTLPTPTYLHHNFLGWFTEKDGGTQITEKSVVTKDITIYAHWKLTEYALQFNPNGGTCNVKSSSVAYGTEYGTLPTPEMVGYTFAGWFTAQTGGSAVSASDRMLTEGATVYAHWTMNKYSIGFDANGGEGSGDSIALRYDTAFTLPKSGYTRQGYKFDGWTTSQGGAKMFELGASVSRLTAEANGTVTLYAVWIPVPLTVSYARQHYPWNGLADVVAKVEGDAGVNYQVAFQVADADGDVKSVESIHAVGQTQIQRVQTLVNGEYAFVWDAANDLAADYKSSGLKMRAVAYDKDAQEVSHSDWVSMGTVNLGDVAGRIAGKQPLVYGADWVSGGAKSVIKANGAVIAELTGKGVFEWMGEAGQTYTLTLEILNSSGVRVGDVYSVAWEWVTRSTLTFVGNIDGVGTQTRVYDDTYAYGEFPHVEKPCYDFLGWFTSATGGDRVRETDISDVSKTLYGHWQASGYQIVFDANGGTGEMSSQVIRTGMKTALAECTYGVSDSACIGWSLSPDGPVQFKNGEEVLDLVPITKGLKLYAVWALEDVKLKSFRQRYPWNGLVDIDFELTGVAGRNYTLLVQARDNVGGTNLNVRTVLDEKLEAKENPLVVSAGTHRIVWNADADLPDGFKCDDVSMRLAFVTTVEFDASGGQCDVATKHYVLGDPYGELPTPTKSGCVFKGWYSDSECTEAVTVESLAVPSVAILYAKWELEK